MVITKKKFKKKTSHMSGKVKVRSKGDALQPDGLLNPAFLNNMKKVAGLYYYGALYQGEPTMKGSGYFDEQYFRYYKDLPMQIKYKVITADCAEEEKAKNDPSVLQYWVETKTGYYLVDMITGKWKYPQLEKNAIMFYHKHKCNRFVIEPKSNGKALIQSLKHDTKIPVEAVDSKFLQLAKPERANQIIGQIETGNVFFPENAPWIMEVVKELVDFDRGEHDDQVDALVHALYYMVFKRKQLRIRSVG